MERTLFSFIWKFSKRDQMALLAMTLITFPFLYATLELPKRIINDAIGAEVDLINVFGFELSQVQFLMALCFGYLGAVLCHGLLKMRLNTMKGITAERLLRRFRFTLLSRMTRFPKAYFRTTSQGELVSMITSEAEPMGGLMGDAVAQPVFQAGQMLIIVVFLFLQSVWFGLAGIALIPLQAWIIPMLQRQINLLNKERIREVRAISSEISETSAGISDLRTNGGLRYRLAMFTDRLGKLFDVRFRIYQKKFFMKFLNNFITQLTPFFFYSVGGILAIRGDITVGALVAALAAYKDLSSPWKELLTYYNQVQDMSLRWDIVTEKFDPRGMVDEKLFDEAPDVIPRLQGDIVFDKVTVRNDDGNNVLQNIDLRFPAGARVGIEIKNQTERQAFAELLTRETLPFRGSVRVGDQDLATLHQAVIAARVGHAHSRPYLFQGTLGSNLLMPLRTHPQEGVGERTGRDGVEARRSGNSLDSLESDWVDPALAGLDSIDDIRGWWFQLIQAMGIDDFMFRRVLNSRMDYDAHGDLAAEIVAVRTEIAHRLQQNGLSDLVYRFDPDQFNPAVPLGGNLLFAAPIREISQTGLAAEKAFLALMIEYGLSEQIIAISQTLVDTLHQTFGRDGTNHPLFTALGIDEELYEELVNIAQRRRDKGDGAVSEDEFALLMTVPFAFTAEQIGPAFPEAFKQEILDIRLASGEQLRARTSNMFIPIEPTNYLPRLTVMENALYGRISAMAGSKREEIENLVADVLVEKGLKRYVAEVIFDLETTLGAANLPTIFHERGAFSRAAIKRPDVLVLEKALVSHTPEARAETRKKLGELLPDATLVFLEESITNQDDYDLFIKISDGRVEGVQAGEHDEAADAGSDDLRKKLSAIAKADLFQSLDQRNQRLLAFAANWYKAEPGQRIFEQEERADAAYLCVAGQAVLSYKSDDGEDVEVTTVEPGRLIGDLSIILDEPRALALKAVNDAVFLRISAEEFRAVVESDRGVLLSLLQTVAGHLIGAADLLRQQRVAIPQEAGPPAPPLA